MEQPEGFREGNYKVCLHQRSVYGLKQAGRDWYLTLSSFLEETGFSRSKNDYCSSTSNVGNELCYFLVWVDDIIIGCKSKGRINKLRDDFNHQYQTGRSWAIVLVSGHRNQATWCYNCQSNALHCWICLRWYALDDCKPALTPADVNSSFSPSFMNYQFQSKPKRGENWRESGSSAILKDSSRYPICMGHGMRWRPLTSTADKQ